MNTAPNPDTEVTQNPHNSPETAPQAEIEAATDADALLEEFGPETEVVVHKVIYNAGGKPIAFYIKEFDQDDELEIAIGPLTFLNNQYVKKAKQEAKMAVALKVHRGVMKPNGDGTYAPLFSLGHLNKMYKNKRRGALLDWLLDQVHHYNPKTNPLKKTPAPKPATDTE